MTMCGSEKNSLPLLWGHRLLNQALSLVRTHQALLTRSRAWSLPCQCENMAFLVAALSFDCALKCAICVDGE
ncbi:unnamed protein product [Microthlaspi erraticum]|uniref:Uncharacterized protein n=1 Tax=Microthlaspi erraticum TaxID=1685480 RepID=A0A6D2JZ60_9BRAS|nr:unnamed protein product [Microthlaspi erraticum]